MRLRLASLLAAALLAPAIPAAQSFDGVSTLIADRVEISAEGRLVASGNVEAMQGDIRLKAGSITYDRETDQLQIEGPIVLSQGSDTIVLADSAALAPDLRNGLLKSARIVLDQQMQLAAVEIDRVDGRYTQLVNTVASSCQVCAAHPVPLWQIRARRVVHDEEERQLYFDHATFEVMGIPVMYLPTLRLPDPTVERWRGFLTPSIRTTDELGFGMKLPYFIPLGRSRDLTLTPYVAASWTRTLEFRYREALRNGEFELNGAVSNDSIVPQSRGYVFADGELDLWRDLQLQFDIEMASDDTYLLEYDYSDADRLASSASISRAERDQLLLAEIVTYDSLRESENNDTQPFLVGDFTWEERFEPSFMGGVLSFVVDAHRHQRRSTEDIIGRDVGRLSGWLDWQGGGVGPWGLLFSGEAQARVDYTTVEDDSTYPSEVAEVTPFTVAELRWPWFKQEGPASHVIEPIAQLVWSPNDGADTPRDESTQLEFDEAGLFSLSRFPAADDLERGLRLNLGLGWTRYDPQGWSLGLLGGRIFRQEDLGQFDGFRSFEGTRSDWLTAFQLSFPNRVTLTNRSLFDDAFDVNKNEARLDWSSEGLDLSASYVWMKPSEAEDRPDVTHEVNLDTGWQVTERWLGSLNWRHDIELDRTALAELGIEYRTDCADFDFSVRRRFTSTEQLDPSTDFNFEIRLAGFGADPSGRPRPSRPGCRG